MTLIFGFALFFGTNALVSAALAIGLAKWLPHAGRWLRSVLAGVLGPSLVGVMILMRDGTQWAAAPKFVGVLGAVVLVVGLPCAYLTSRWQDGVRDTERQDRVSE